MVGICLLPWVTHRALARVSKPVSTSLDQQNYGGRRGFLKLLLGNVGLVVPTLRGSGNAYADEQGVSSSRMSYSRFLEYLDKDRVNKVDLFEKGTIAIVEAVSPKLGNRIQLVRVQLPGLRSFFRSLERKIFILQLTMLKKTLGFFFST